jgi:hypothetical protein
MTSKQKTFKCEARIVLGSDLFCDGYKTQNAIYRFPPVKQQSNFQLIFEARYTFLTLERSKLDWYRKSVNPAYNPILNPCENPKYSIGLSWKRHIQEWTAKEKGALISAKSKIDYLTFFEHISIKLMKY